MRRGSMVFRWHGQAEFLDSVVVRELGQLRLPADAWRLLFLRILDLAHEGHPSIEIGDVMTTATHAAAASLRQAMRHPDMGARFRSPDQEIRHAELTAWLLDLGRALDSVKLGRRKPKTKAADLADAEIYQIRSTLARAIEILRALLRKDDRAEVVKFLAQNADLRPVTVRRRLHKGDEATPWEILIQAFADEVRVYDQHAILKPLLPGDLAKLTQDCLLKDRRRPPTAIATKILASILNLDGKTIQNRLSRFEGKLGDLAVK
jgi:hypothetical protein